MTTSTRMSENELISKKNEALYVTLIENYGLSFVLPFLKVIDSVSYLTLNDKIEASKIYLSNVGRIVEKYFVHCNGQNVKVVSGFNDDMGFFIELKCWECDGFEFHGTKSLGLKDGKPVNRIRQNWHPGLKRKVVPHNDESGSIA
ncbi:hypothetical protein [Paenibacillus lautus]|uniref:hypothetical protein n=1 Tax=Paenibacillus lautus TaxID=1401 RepID=UPI003D265C83